MKQNRFMRLVATLVVLAMLGTMMPTVLAAEPSQFVDFPQGWSKEAMTFAVNNGIINGKSETTIEPKANLTRAEMAAIINRAFAAEVSDDISAYTDVSSDAWYYNDIGKAVHMETFRGDGNGRMRPDEFITREEVMAVLARAMVLESDDFSPINTFGDYSSVSEWSRPYLAALIGEGYVDGYEDKTLRPLANITREEFVQLMYNIFKTYLTVEGSYNEVASLDCVMINHPDITLSNVTVEGDLVLGDGVATGRVNLNNVKIKGRLLARGGFITLTNVTVDEGVVVKNVNGRTHFFNWNTDSVFNGIRELTYTTYLESTTKYPSVSGGFSGGGGGGSGGGGGGGSSSAKEYDYSVTYYFQSAADLNVYTIDKERTLTGEASSGVVKKADIPDVTNYVYNKDKSTAQIKITSSGDNELKIYYDLVKYSVSYTNPDGTTGKADIAHGQKAGDVIHMPDTYTDDDGNTYDVKWEYTDSNGEEQVITPDHPVTGEDTVTPVLYARVVFYYTSTGSEPEVISIEKGKNIGTQLPDAPVREGYTFGGWNTQPDGSGDTYTADTAISVPVTVYAVWTPVSVDPVYRTVTFEYNYSGAPAGFYAQYTDVPDGSKIVEPEAPERDGYTFGGWYTDEELTVKYDFETAVTSNITLYANWIEQTEKFDVSFYYGVNEEAGYIGTITDVAAGSTVAAADYERIYSDEGIIFDDEGLPGYVDGSYTHMIYPELRYQNSDGSWMIFDETTSVISDMKVYYTFKYIQLMIDGSFLGMELSNVSLYTHYASDTRFMDTLKDAMQLSRDPISNALKDKDAEIIRKLADTTGLIDTDGYVVIKPFGLHIAEIIDADDIRGEIRAYLKKSLSGADAEIERVVETAKLQAVVDYIGEANLSEPTMEAVVQYIRGLRADEAAYEELCTGIVNIIAGYSFFDEFMSSFVNKTDEYTVNNDTLKLVKGVANAVYDFSADEIITLLKNKGFGAFISLYGEDEFKIMFAESQQEYYDGIMAIAAQIEDGTVTSAAYTAKMNVKVNFARIFEAVVSKFKNKLVTGLNGDNNSYYKDNAYLVEFVEQDIMNKLFDYNASAVSTTNSGYKIKTVIEYYDTALENLILFDKALLWYGDLTEQERDEMREQYAADMVTMFADINELLASTQDGTDVIAGYTLDELMSLIDSVLSMIDRMGDNSFGGLEKDLDLMLADVKESLEKLEATGETPLGFTVTELLDIYTKLSSASDAYGKKDYPSANELYAEAMAAILNQIVELVKEIDTNGTINGEDFNEKLSHIPIVNKFASQIINIISNMASNGFAKEYTKENILETFDVERIEDIIIGHDTDDRFTVDTVVDFISQYIQDNKVSSPEHSADETVIDQYEKISGDDSITLRRYLY